MNPKHQHLWNRFSSQISRAEPILFLGAGFSLSATDKSDRPLPNTKQLTQELWAIAFPQEDFDPNTDLGDAYHCALSRNPKELEALLTRRLTVKVDALPEFYRHWFSMPWHACYTLNVDNLPTAATLKFSLPRRIVSISATSTHAEEISHRAQALPVVHLTRHSRNQEAVVF